MKIAVCSDLHLEFQDLDLQNTEGAEVLILSGDIMIAEDLHNHKHFEYNPYTPGALEDLGRRQATALRFRGFLKRCSERFPHVIYVAGNHEFYHGRWKASLDHLREECAVFPNVYFLEDDIKTIGEHTFIGCTLWTDMNKGDPLTLHAINDMMNDFRVIRNDEHGYTKLRPAHIMYRHQQTMSYLKQVLQDLKDKKAKIKSTGLQPHELTKPFMNWTTPDNEETLQCQWNDMIQKLKETTEQTRETNFEKKIQHQSSTRFPQQVLVLLIL